MCLKNSEQGHVSAGKLILSVIAMPTLVYSQRWVSMLSCTQGLTIKTKVNAWIIILWSLFGDLCSLLLVKVHKFLLIAFTIIIAPQLVLILTLFPMMIQLLTMRGLTHLMSLRNQLNYLIIFLNKKLTTNHQLICLD